MKVFRRRISHHSHWLRSGVAFIRNIENRVFFLSSVSSRQKIHKNSSIDTRWYPTGNSECVVLFYVKLPSFWKKLDVLRTKCREVVAVWTLRRNPRKNTKKMTFFNVIVTARSGPICRNKLLMNSFAFGSILHFAIFAANRAISSSPASTNPRFIPKLFPFYFWQNPILNALS